MHMSREMQIVFFSVERLIDVASFLHIFWVSLVLSQSVLIDSQSNMLLINKQL